MKEEIERLNHILLKHFNGNLSFLKIVSIFRNCDILLSPSDRNSQTQFILRAILKICFRRVGVMISF